MSEAPEFQVVANLLALLADGKATAKKFDELRQTIERAEASAAKLEAARQAHDQKVTADRAALEARTAVLVKREADLAAREGLQAREAKFIAKWKADHDFVDDPNLNGGAGLTVA